MIFLDFETRSMAELKEVGGRNYSRDETTEPTCLAAVSSEGWVYVWTPFSVPGKIHAPRLTRWSDAWIQPTTMGHEFGTERPDWLLSQIEDSTEVVAHNAEGFDRHVWMAQGWPEVTWLDSLPLFRRVGLTGPLDAYGEGKSKGKASAMMMAKPRKGRFVPPNAQMLTAAIQYCLDDVLLMRQAWTTEQLGRPGADDAALAADAIINRRGFEFDDRLAAQLIALSEEHNSRVEESLRGLDERLTPELLRSQPRFRQWLADHGVNVPDVKKDTLSSVVTRNYGEKVGAAIQARLDFNRVAPAKLARALAVMDPEDKRIRHSMAYHSAHTGRWGGRDFQPQNLPRPVPLPFGTLAAVLAGEPLPAECPPLPDVVSTLVRGCVIAPPGHWLGVVDYSQIEARVLCWIADDEKGLAVFRCGADPYKAQAAKLWRCSPEEVEPWQRQVGKVAVLGCGYQMGYTRFASYAAGYGIDLTRAGLDPALVVESWRNSHTPISGEVVSAFTTPEGDVLPVRAGGLWQLLRDRVKHVVCGEVDQAEAGRCIWTMDGKHLLCIYPSGRVLRYRDARLEWREPAYGGRPRPTVIYTHPRGFEVSLYGGKLTENVVQSVARDIMADALVRLEQDSLPVVLHVHDEVVCELPDPDLVAVQTAIMVDTPGWAEGCPIEADGTAMVRWAKG